MSEFKAYCIAAKVFKEVALKIHALDIIVGVTNDLYNLNTNNVITGIARIVYVGQPIVRYATKEIDDYVTILIKNDYVDNVAYLSDKLYNAIDEINNLIIDNSLGRTYVINTNAYQRINNKLELEVHFPEHSKLYRKYLLKYGHIAVNFCDKVTPIYDMGEFWFDTYYATVFDVPSDVNSEIERLLNMNLESDKFRLKEDAETFYIKETNRRKSKEK